MSANNGVIRIGKKGLKCFAFGDEGTPDGTPFTVDVVVAFQQWMLVDDSFRPEQEDAEGNRRIPTASMPEYHAAAVRFVEELRGAPPEGCQREPLTTAEALDFVARLRECYDDLLVFFRPKLREERVSPVTSEAELRFSEEPTAN